ncbi:MAG: hypothetical protein L3J28_10365 [Candidatus Polarisedimenticolaceae bacterium]|nr:hypothetical protein [Candidatus Polarisedimenticolaceae bacterium]
MTIATYSIGKAKKPKINHDNGFLDKFAIRAPTNGEKIDYAIWYAKLEAAEAIQNIPFMPKNDIPDALAAYRHFLKGSGNRRWFSYERYVANDPGGKITLKNIINDAAEGAIYLYRSKLTRAGLPFDFQMTGSALTANEGSVYFPYPATENWQKAIGGHNLWVSADIHVEKNPSGIIHFIEE